MRLPRSSGLPIAWRLHLVTFATLLSLAAVSATLYVLEAQRIEMARVATLEAMTESGVAIAAQYETEARNGRMTQAAAQAAALSAMRAMRYFGQEYVWVNDMQPRVVMHPFKPELEGQDVSNMADPAGKRLFVAFVDTVRASGGGTVPYLWPRPGASAPVPKLSYVKGFAPWGWVIGTGVYVDDLILARRRLALGLAALTLLAGSVVGGLIWHLGRGIARPARALTSVTEHLLAGDTALTIPGQDRGDEFGALARAMAVLRESSLERARLERAARAETTAKERHQAAMDDHTQEFGTSVSGVMGMLGIAASAIQSSAEAMADAADTTHKQADETTAGAAEATDRLGVAAGTAERMAANADEIARRLHEVTAATEAAVQAAAQSDAMVRGLVHVTAEIGSVVSLISAIAGQTNLLALNATIEAARAGEAGKGFAVVAGEVKNLAAQTHKATEEVVSRIDAVRGSTDQAGAAIAGVNQAIGRVREAASAIASAIEQQGDATREIAGTVRAVSAATQDVSRSMVELTKVADRTSAASQAVLGAAGEIRSQTVALREEMEQFLLAVRGTEDERRAYQRIHLTGVTVTLRQAGGDALVMQLPLLDISRGGAGLGGRSVLAAGADVLLDLPVLQSPLAARVSRVGDGRIGIAFRQDAATLALADRAMQALQSRAAA